jgi:hypothetical protein
MTRCNEAEDTSRRRSAATRSRLTAAAMVLALPFCSATAALASEPPNPEDLTQGSWELDLARSNYCTPAPQVSKRDIIDAGWGLIAIHWTGINSKGEPIDVRYVYRYDGEKYPSTIDSPADEAITWKLVSPHRVEFTHWSKDNEITEELVRTVSSDGQEMTQMRKYIGPEECVDIQVFQRL